jgi:hypothetical protein
MKTLLLSLIKIWKWERGDKWIVKRSCWPYPKGYMTYNRKRRTILDTGLSRERAIALCKELNA